VKKLRNPLYLAVAQLVEDCLTPLAVGTKRDLALDALVSVELAKLQSVQEQSKQQKTRDMPDAEPGDAEQERMYGEALQVEEEGGRREEGGEQIDVGGRRRRREEERRRRAIETRI